MLNALSSLVQVYDLVLLSLVLGFLVLGLLAGLSVSAYRHGQDRNKALDAWSFDIGMSDIQAEIAPRLNGIARYRLTLMAIAIGIVVGLVFFQSPSWSMRCASFAAIVVGAYEHWSLKKAAKKAAAPAPAPMEPSFATETTDPVA